MCRRGCTALAGPRPQTHKHTPGRDLNSAECTLLIYYFLTCSLHISWGEAGEVFWHWSEACGSSSVQGLSDLIQQNSPPHMETLLWNEQLNEVKRFETATCLILTRNSISSGSKRVQDGPVESPQICLLWWVTCLRVSWDFDCSGFFRTPYCSHEARNMLKQRDIIRFSVLF